MTTTASTTTVAQHTVLDRLLAAGITRDRALSHLADGWVRVDDVVVTDPDQPAEPPADVEIRIVGPIEF